MRRSSSRREEGYSRPARPRLEVVLSEDENLVEARVQAYLAALRLRRAMNKALRPLGLTFRAWRVLIALDRLTKQYRDAVSQREIAEHARMDENTVSSLMRTLVLRGLVDRGPDNWCLSYRIWLSKHGEDLVCAAWPAVCAVARRGAVG